MHIKPEAQGEPENPDAKPFISLENGKCGDSERRDRSEPTNIPMQLHESTQMSMGEAVLTLHTLTKFCQPAR